MERPNPISQAFQSGLLREDDTENLGWTSMGNEVNSMLKRADNRTTLFLGAAISSFKPTCFPAWDKFIELIYTSQIQQAVSELPGDTTELQDSLRQSVAQALDYSNAHRVPNYKVTETLARRLGKDYLRLLEAFKSRQDGDGWLINHVHRWAAECLMTGDALSIVTTNFDDCIERALSAAGANSYLLTGDHRQDGVEIERLLRLTTKRLILIISGPRACHFAQNMLPRLGKSVGFLYKLHGSCYAPDSCIDTRLQRQQGLPAYSVDILDYLLAKSVFFIVGFSGGDLNDNTDYLRMIHNKRQAQLVWLQFRGDQIEPGVRNLLDATKEKAGGAPGESRAILRCLHGYITGQRIRWNEEPSEFKEHVVEWCRGLGTSWCKLVVLDLLELCGQRYAQTESLQRLGFVKSHRQDWNDIVEVVEKSPAEKQQLEKATACMMTTRLLRGFLEAALGGDDSSTLISDFEVQRLEIQQQHLQAASGSDTAQTHAQDWVLSALYGVLLYCGEQQRAAKELLSYARNAAYLVGDLQSHQMIGGLIASLPFSAQDSPASSSTPSPTKMQHTIDGPVLAFLPSLDNVSAKANQNGVPPGIFVRALMHRAMLFADRIAVNSNVFTNSAVFINEILFGGREELNEFYLDFIQPVIVSDNPSETSPILEMHRASNSRLDYISENMSEAHMAQLDSYYLADRADSRFLFNRMTDLADNYIRWVRRAATSERLMTRNHLMEHWKSLDIYTHSPSARFLEVDEELATDMIDTVLKVVDLFTEHLNGPLTRSKLYSVAGLFVTIADDNEAIRKQMTDDTDKASIETLISGRQKLLERPWLSGPICHELFDVPYRYNPMFQQLISGESSTSIVFLEPHEVSSMVFMANLARQDVQLEIYDGAVTAESCGQASAILLAQASEDDITVCRRGLAPIRQRISEDTILDAETMQILVEQLGAFKREAADAEDSEIAMLATLDETARRNLLGFLEHCTFVLRKGEPLDRMYEQPEMTLPGVLKLAEVRGHEMASGEGEVAAGVPCLPLVEQVQFQPAEAVLLRPPPCSVPSFPSTLLFFLSVITSTMPPRIQPQRLSLPSQCQCLRTRPSLLPEAHLSARSFHASPPTLEGNLNEKKVSSRPRSTKLRREMKEWLSGPGSRFRRQFPGSTNYLSAYDREGNLRRRRIAQNRSNDVTSPKAEAAAEEEALKQEAQEGIDDAERAARAEGRAAARAQRAAQLKIAPKEMASDMRPFPLNDHFKSEPVLSEELREELYHRIVRTGMDLQAVSAAYGVDMRRVAAVVRLKTVEKQWIEDGKTLAKPYNDAVMAMLPKTPVPGSGTFFAHESINDLPVHSATRKQLFYPTSESRHFTREDAAKAFSPTLLPADKRIAHPQLIDLERWNNEGLSRSERNERFAKLDDAAQAAAEEKERKRKEWAERTQRTVQGRRWDFKFQDISAENVGKDGRSSQGVGHRYGMPHTERKRGEIKIPLSVE
ncbi:hypothetical protein Q7P37_009472 [Cladosporium fusiforme]